MPFILSPTTLALRFRQNNGPRVRSPWLAAEEKTIKKYSALNLSAHDELTHLRKENEQLRRERELLTKAAVVFVQEAA
ncbi:MAG TPA: hypothetical protein EYQ43_09925 [Methyloprofundus sp.]|nr:hypothetical protein [Methyloprofundus sp.]